MHLEIWKCKDVQNAYNIQKNMKYLNSAILYIIISRENNFLSTFFIFYL